MVKFTSKSVIPAARYVNQIRRVAVSLAASVFFLTWFGASCQPLCAQQKPTSARPKLLSPEKIVENYLKAIGGKKRVTSVRAAAISASYILVNRAALELDIDPEEFEVLEPRIYRIAQGRAVPHPPHGSFGTGRS